MKYCKNCKAELEDNQKFCHRCGSNEFDGINADFSNNSDENLKMAQTENNADNINPAVTSSPVSKSITSDNAKLIKIIIAVVAVIIVIVAILTAIALRANNKQESASSSSTTYKSTTTQESEDISESKTDNANNQLNSDAFYNNSTDTTKNEITTREGKKSPEDCFVSTKKTYEKVKPFFAKNGYNFDDWNVTVDNGNIFIAETSSEVILLQDSSLAINLDKGGNTTNGFFAFTHDNDVVYSIQICFNADKFGADGKEKAYELLDIIFDDVSVNDKKLSEYIESEYKSHLNEGNVSNWNNGKIKYLVGFDEKLTYIYVGRN